MRNQEDWDIYYMSLAHMTAMMSRDTSTKTGCVIVNKHNRIVSVGYNDFPSGINDNIKERRDRSTKYLYTEHAERNCIYNTNINLINSKMYVTWYPCADCARAIIQKQINEVIIHKEFNDAGANNIWNESNEAAKQMFEEAGTIVRFWSGKVMAINGLKNGNIIEL